MIVCICRRISDGEIRKAVQDGGACNMRDLCCQLGVASQCGKCGRYAREILQKTLSEVSSTQQR